MILANPLRYGWHRRARRRRVRRRNPRVPSWLRLLRTRRRHNPHRRRRRNPSLFSRRYHMARRHSRRRRRRHNPWVRFFAHRGGHRRRGGRRHRRNPDGLIGAVRTGITPRRIRENLVDGVQGALGWAGTTFLTRVESRMGLDRVLAVAGEGWLRKILGYVVRGVNVGLLAGLTGRLVSDSTRRNLIMGGVTSIGVQVINDVAPLLGGPGAAVQGLLSDYVLAAGPYATAMRPFGVGDYLLASGQPSLPYPANTPVYGGDDPYGSF